MINVIEISMYEFKNNIYEYYISIFPDSERRRWYEIRNTYRKKIEHFYKIVLDNNIIGFFMLEKIDDNHPYYLDYFAIYDEYQNKGYGKIALKYLLDNIILDNGLIGDIERVDDNNLITIKRFKFYERLGFEKVDSIYLLWNVLYTPIVYYGINKYNKEEVDKLFFDYYLVNMGEKNLKAHCKIIK